MVHRCWRCRRRAPCHSEQLGKSASMIVCSCLAITDEDIEQALVEILSLPDAPLPTPGIVYRHLRKKMVCCGCSPLAVCTIYEKIDQLAEKGRRVPLCVRLRPGPPPQVRQRHPRAEADRARSHRAAAPAQTRPRRRQAGPRAGRIAAIHPQSLLPHWLGPRRWRRNKDRPRALLSPRRRRATARSRQATQSSARHGRAACKARKTSSIF
jgi:hypothetical protein